MFVGFSVFHSKVAALEETRSHTLEMVQIFILSFFCRLFFSFFVISVLSVICLSFFVVFLSFQFWSVILCHLVEILSLFCHFGAIFATTWKNIKNCLKSAKTMTKNDNAPRKMQFLQPAKLSFCLPCFCHLVENFVIVVILAPFSQQYGNPSKIV